MQIIQAQKVVKPFSAALIVSRFNTDITNALYAGAVQRWQEFNFMPSLLTTVWVPGAIEIPYIAQYLAQQKKHSILIALGAVIRGETSHYDYVCQQVSYGCQKISLDNNIPVIFGVLTTENEAQALDRVGGKHGHKGREAIEAAVEMISVLQQLS